MSERINPFSGGGDLPVFEPKPKRDKPVAEETLAKIADQNGFPSRQAPKPKAPVRKPRLHRTGRNVQFNAKATQATVDRIYKIADERKLLVAEVLELMLETFDKQAGRDTKSP